MSLNADTAVRPFHVDFAEEAVVDLRRRIAAWRQMVTTDTEGNVRAIKDQIALAIAEAEQGAYDEEADLNGLLDRLSRIRSRLERRIDGLPDDATLRAHLKQLPGRTLHVLLVSEAWDTGNVGGEEVDVEWLLDTPAAPALT